MREEQVLSLLSYRTHLVFVRLRNRISCAVIHEHAAKEGIDSRTLFTCMGLLWVGYRVLSRGFTSSTFPVLGKGDVPGE